MPPCCAGEIRIPCHGKMSQVFRVELTRTDMQAKTLLNGLFRGLVIAGTAATLSGCMVSGLYQSVQDHPIKEQYDFNREHLSVPALDDAAEQTVDLSYRTYVLHDKGKREARYAKFTSRVDFGRNQQDLTAAVPAVRVGEPPVAGKHAEVSCPRISITPVLVSKVPEPAMITFDELQKQLAPCKSGYVAYTVYGPQDGQYPIALYRVSDAGVVSHTEAFAPQHIEVKDYSVIWGNTGKIILMPVAVTADMALYTFEWAYMASTESAK